MTKPALDPLERLRDVLERPVEQRLQKRERRDREDVTTASTNAYSTSTCVSGRHAEKRSRMASEGGSAVFIAAWNEPRKVSIPEKIWS